MGENRRVMTAPDPVLGDSVEAARSALLEQVPAEHVGEHLGAEMEGPEDGEGTGSPGAAESTDGTVGSGVVTHRFACTQRGYPGWFWAVTVVRSEEDGQVTLDELALLPGPDAIVAPAWVPWRDRIQPGDLSPGDLLPADEDDPRMVPTYLAGQAPSPSEKPVVDELGLGRARVLSLEGRDLAAQRWYDGPQGPDIALAQSAPARCATCGFLVQLSGPLSTMFGVCANEFANDDARVVSFDHGCGAHSEAQLRKKQLPPPVPDHVFDTLSRDDYEEF